MYVNKDGHCISECGDICLDCIHNGYNCCLFHKAMSNYVCNSKNNIDMTIELCEEYKDNEDEGSDDWWD